MSDRAGKLRAALRSAHSTAEVASHAPSGELLLCQTEHVGSICRTPCDSTSGMITLRADAWRWGGRTVRHVSRLALASPNTVAAKCAGRCRTCNQETCWRASGENCARNSNRCLDASEISAAPAWRTYNAIVKPLEWLDWACGSLETVSALQPS